MNTCFQVLDQSGLFNEAACVLGLLELSQNAGSCLSSEANRVQLRIQKLQHTLTRMSVTGPFTGGSAHHHPHSSEFILGPSCPPEKWQDNE